jgi:protein-tyrosine phosphatase
MVEAAVATLSHHLGAGRGVGAHCFAGLGRSPLLVAAVLINHGHSDEDAIDLVSAARGYRVPEMDDQHDWLFDFARRTRP